MGKWEDFKEGFYEGLGRPSGPDDCADGPKSCTECLIWLAFILICCCILGCIYSVLDIEPPKIGPLPWMVE